MKVILKQEVDNLGYAGDVVDVADGYGRNYLIPRGMALRATKGAMKEAAALTRSRRAREAQTLDQATAYRDVVEARTLRIPARVDERGRLYGSVGVGDIHAVLKERGHQVERKRIDLARPIKEIGTYEVDVQIHPQVVATVTVEVVDEEGNVIAGQIVEPEIPPLQGQGAEAGEPGSVAAGTPESTELASPDQAQAALVEAAAASNDIRVEEVEPDTDYEALAQQAVDAADEIDAETSDPVARP
jgi:large subunit ribosomal protein L9